MLKKVHPRFFDVLLFVLGVLLVYSLFANHPMLPDVIFSLIVVFGLKWFTHGTTDVASRVLIVLAIVGCLAGTLGLYAHFAIGFVGYDKLVHFVSGMAIAAVALSTLNESPGRQVIIALLLVLGAGSIIELSEFVGTRYFGNDVGGVFAIGDGLPIVSDLQKYDTYFDLATNLFGGMLVCLLHWPRKGTARKR